MAVDEQPVRGERGARVPVRVPPPVKFYSIEYADPARRVWRGFARALVVLAKCALRRGGRSRW